MAFRLDKQIENDSFLACRHKNIQIRLMNDSRYFWIILVPEVTQGTDASPVTEIHHLSDPVAGDLWALARYLSKQLKTHMAADKINVAAIGNLVSQLHFHIVARHQNDPAWPAPIWGHGTPIPQKAEESADRLAHLQDWLAKCSGTM